MKSDRRHVVATAAISILLGLLAVTALVSTSQSGLWIPARNTLLLGMAVCAIALPMGTLLALLIVRTDTPGRGLAALLLGAMLVVPLYLQMTGWEAMVGKLGWQTSLFGSAGQPWLSGWRAAIWLHALAATAWTALIVGLGLRLVDPQLEEEALLDASSSQVFLRVTLPRALASLGVAALWILMITAGEMTVTNVYQVRNFAEALHTSMAWGDDQGQTWLQAFPSLLLTIVLLGFGLILATKLAPSGEISALRKSRVYRLGIWRWVAMGVLLASVLIIVAVPVVGLCYQSGKETEIIAGQTHRHWSAGKFFEMTISNPWQSFRDDIRWTLVMGAVTATSTIVLAAPLAWWARCGGRRALPALLTSAVFLAVPGPLLSLGLIWLMSSTNLSLLSWLYNRTIFTPVVLMTARAMPLAILICWYALRTVGRDTLDSAATEGAGSATRFWRIGAVAHWPAFTAAWVTAWAVSMGDVTATANILVLPPGIDTVAQRIFQMAHFGATDQLSGLSLCCFIGFIAVAALLIGLLRPLLRDPNRF